jgi:hypothetical protein
MGRTQYSSKLLEDTERCGLKRFHNAHQYGQLSLTFLEPHTGERGQIFSLSATPILLVFYLDMEDADANRS